MADYAKLTVAANSGWTLYTAQPETLLWVVSVGAIHVSFKAAAPSSDEVGIRVEYGHKIIIPAGAAIYVKNIDGVIASVMREVCSASLAYDTSEDTLKTSPKQGKYFLGTTTPLAATGIYQGPSRDVGVAEQVNHRYTAFNVLAYADQSGTVRIEVSNDGTTWRRATADVAVSASGPVILSIPICARYHRSIYVNGTTAQGAFLLNSSFTAA